MIYDFKTLPQLLELRVKATPDIAAFYEKNGACGIPPTEGHTLKGAVLSGRDNSGQWDSTTWKEFSQKVTATASRMIKMGIQPGDRVAIMLPVGLTWEIIHHAVLRVGALVVGLEKADPPERLLEIIENSKPAAIFSGDGKLSQFLPDHLASIFKINVSFNSSVEQGWTSWENFENIPAEIDRLPPMPPPDQPATIIYTSGTTGAAKGILYTHGQLALAAKSIIHLYGNFIEEQTPFICWLPLTALSQRIANISGIMVSAKIYFLPDPRKIMETVKEISPGFFFGVPRFYEKLWAGIIDKIHKTPFYARGFIHLAIGIGGIHAHRSREKRKIGIILKTCHFMADRMILSKIRGIMGHRLKYMVSGSAPIPGHLLEFYHAIGLVILEAYGLSENAIPMAANRHDNFRFGTVGVILPENEVRFDPESVIQVRGPGLFSGYHGDEKSRPFTGDGYYDTGDYGELINNFLTLKGRRAELIKTSTGRRIAPVSVENAIKKYPLIDQAVVFGTGHKRLVALITLGPSAASDYHLAGHWQDPPPKFLEDLKNGLSGATASLPSAEKPGGYIILEQTFSVITGDLTSSQKYRRNNIQNRYQSWMNDLFSKLDASENLPDQYIFLSEAQIRQAQIALMPEQKDAISSKLVRFLRLVRMLFQISEIYLWNSLPHFDLGENWLKRRRDRALRRIGRIITHELSYLKGPAAKAGQMASYVTEAVPLPIRESLSKLQDVSVRIANERVIEIVEKSLGRPLDSMFSRWEKMPIAVATMCQVHLARLKSGESVVVKVLHPDTRKVTRADMDILKIIFSVLGKTMGIANGPEIMRELLDLFVQECDLRREAMHQEIFKKLFSHDPRVLVPKIYWQCTSQDVLTMEYMSGVSYQQFKDAASQQDKNRVGQIIFETISTAICRYGIFNADPHPGNYLFSGEKVCFLDFGFVKRWPGEFINNWKIQSLSGARGNLDTFSAVSDKLGFKGVKSYKELMEQFRSISYEPWKEDKVFKFTSEFMNSELKKLFFYGGKVGTLRMPPEYIAISRLFAGKYAVLSDLQAEANWHKILMPLLQAPTLSLEDVEKTIIH